MIFLLPSTLESGVAQLPPAGPVVHGWWPWLSGQTGHNYKHMYTPLRPKCTVQTHYEAVQDQSQI